MIEGMMQKTVSIFIKSAGILLIITAVAKIVSSFGTARIEDYPDPVFLIRFRDMFRIFGIIEAIAAAICFWSDNQKLQAGIIALLAGNFLLYRVGVYSLGYSNLCPCLGTLTDLLHIPPRITDTALMLTLIYLLIGSCCALFCLWRRGEKGGLEPSSISAE